MRYDIDYSSLNPTSSVEDCRFAKNNSTICSILNSILSEHKFLGMYGTVEGVKKGSVYSIAKKVLPDSALSPENTLIFLLADGSLIGFNKNATNCSVPPGTPMSKEVLSGDLANCIGFIDVNGLNPPNKEITCDNTEYTTLDPTTSCSIKRTVGDVFPVVFHDDTAQPASNAAKEVISPGGKLTEAEQLGIRRQFDKWRATPISRGLSREECESLPESYGIKNCRTDEYNDGWAAAVKACGGVQNLPTEDDLYALAKVIYGASNCNDVNKECTGTPDYSKVPKLQESGFGSRNYNYIWSGKETAKTNAKSRTFSKQGSSAGNPSRQSLHTVICMNNL